MKTGYMIMRYMTKKKNEKSHIITPPNFVMDAGKAHGVYMNDIEASVAFEELTNKVLDRHDEFKEDMSERTFDTRVFHDKESGFSYVYRLATVLVQE